MDNSSIGTEDLLNVTQAARRLHVAPHVIRFMIRSGSVPIVRIARLPFLDPDGLRRARAILAERAQRKRGQ